jgi:PTH1 family peptidyl-tRNA hydrolase
MWIILGLGNPGPDYACTRHNAGFMVVDILARRWRITLQPATAAVHMGRGAMNGHPILLAEPQTFMNRSGGALAELPHDVDDRLLVLYDDLDLPAGQLRVRPRGGSGGHLGVASIAEQVGPAFARVRVGIGRPPHDVDTATYVLAPLSETEREAMCAAAERAADAVETVVADGVEAAMSRFNGRMAPQSV